jgi:uncharacterized repeat protein (TIGR02543 family)
MNKNLVKRLTVIVMLLTVLFAGCEQPVEGKDTYTVSIDAQGGTPDPDAVTVNAGSVIDPLPVVSKGGYAFQGWYTAADGGTEFTVTTQVTGNLTLYARWVSETVTYTVSYDTQGGTPNPVAASVSAGGVIDPLPVVSKIGHDFQGWFTAADGGTEFTVTTPVTENLTLYARWLVSVDSFLQLHHDFNPSRYATGAFAPLIGDSANTKAEPKNSGWLSGSGTGNGKTFYFYKTGDKKAMSAGATYLDLGSGAGSILNSAAQGYTVAAYIYIAGDWTGNGNFIWTFAETNAVGQSTGQAVWFSPSGASHTTTTMTGGWSGPNSISQGGSILQNQWHHVAYTQNGKTETNNAKLYVDGVQVVEGTISVIPSDFNALVFNTLGGPCFTGDNNLSQTMFTDFRIYNTALEAAQIANLAGNLNDLKAVTQWTPSGFFSTLSFDSNSSGDVENPAPVYVLTGQTAPSLPAPTRSGYDFSGWYTQAAAGTKFTTETTVNASLTLYARWSAKPTIVGYSGTTVTDTAPNLLDGDLATLWTTNRLNQFYTMDLSFRKTTGELIAAGDPAGLNGYRHWITIDLGQVVDNISKLEYHPRQGGGINQLVRDCEVYVSEEVNLKINIQRALDANLAKKVGTATGWDVVSSTTGWRPEITFTNDGSAGGTPTPVRARYIQLRVTGTSDAAAGTYHAAVGEIKLYTDNGTEEELVYPAGTQAYGDSHNADQRGMLPMQVIDGNATGSNWLSGNINISTVFNQSDFEALLANLPADPHFDVGHWITLDLGASPEPYTGLKYHRRRDNNALGNFSGVEIYASNTLIDPAAASNPGMSLVKTFTGLPIGTLNNVERWTLLDFGQPVDKRYLHIRITGEIYTANASYGNDYNAGPNTGNESQVSDGGQLGPRWGSAAAAEFTIVR